MSEKGVTSLIQVLEQFSVRNNQRLPAYTFTSRDNACKKMCTVTYCKETVTGRGGSKKKAKRAAAKNLIHLLCTKSDSVRLELLPIARLVDDTIDLKEKTSSHEKNFIGQLLEYCKNNTLPPPNFEIQELGLFKFQVDCTVDNVQELVIGPNRKRAKQMAAKMALEAIKLRDSIRYDDVQLDDSTSDCLPDWWQISVYDLLRYCSKSQLPEPTFSEVAMKLPTAKGVKCTINNVEKLGTGLTEAGAKMAAARLMYQTIRLAETTGNVDSLFRETRKVQRKKRRPTNVDTDNHIGQLYEYCRATELPTPSFKVVGHKWNIYRFSKFRVRCTVGDIKFDADSRRKKVAKQAAAKKMLDKVRPIDQNETKEIVDDADAPLCDDDLDSDNSEQSTQPDDLQAEENETKEITEEAVLSVRIDGIGLNDSEQSTQHDDLQVEENETKEIAEEAALISRDDGVGSDDEIETVELTEEAVLLPCDDGIGLIDNEHNDIHVDKTLEIRYNTPDIDDNEQSNNDSRYVGITDIEFTYY
ncbi:uncharacterized protein LOC119078853 [Bradysia coprophila]|uniref:uncharacterized protein LOC119078853 n=1 Tax=Bradysia coprophila TaxID=38358 RepID=UPI00187D7553|nr:uncharacterized protein LOC119078853 [Bradysia coprophila]